MSPDVRRRSCRACTGRTIDRALDLQDVWHGVAGYFRYRACSRCGSLNLDVGPPAPEESYADYYTHSDVVTGSERWHRSQLRSRRIRRSIERDLGSSVPHRVLDYGCGDGQHLAAIAPGRCVVGVEQDAVAARRARARGLRVARTIEELPSQSTFDLIILRHVIEHVEDPVAVTRRLLTSLEPQAGRLLIVTPNAHTVSRRIHGRYWRGFDAPRHVTIFTPDGLEQLARNAGLVDARVTTTSRGSGSIAALSLVARPSFRRLRSRLRYPLARMAGAFAAIPAHAVQCVRGRGGDELVLRWDASAVIRGGRS